MILTSKLTRFLIISVLCIVVGVVAVNFSAGIPTTDHPNKCTIIDTATIRLAGTIDKDMKQCAEDLITPNITTVILNSTGGDVGYGRAIGYRLGNVPRRLIIEKYCLSSCGNYFVPAAQSIELKPGAVIGLHGSPDPQMLSSNELEKHLSQLSTAGSQSVSSAQRVLDRKILQREQQLAEESKFAKQFSIPMGWRLYRDADETKDAWRKHFVDGSDVGITIDDFLIVEEKMITSCLPHIEIIKFQDILETSVLKTRRWKTLQKKIGAYRSFGLLCKV